MTDMPALQVALERFPYGIFVASTRAEGNVPLAIVATWVSQVSFDPPILTLSLEKANAFSEAVLRTGKFALSLLPSTGIQVAKGVLKHGPYIAGTDIEEAFEETPEGLLVTRESAATFVCSMLQAHDTGDHLLVLAQVARGEGSDPAEALTLAMTGWKYRPKKGRTSRE
jgi:flavin reductase (DIM6/NTAB) family NADH-FMN oxidoreductase RutF